MYRATNNDLAFGSKLEMTLIAYCQLLGTHTIERSSSRSGIGECACSSTETTESVGHGAGLKSVDELINNTMVF